MREELVVFPPSSPREVAYDNDQTSKRRKTTRARFDSEAHTSALKRAKELQTNLSPEHPTFIKQLQRSHVMQKFKPGVPVEFRKLHLPTHDVEVILEDERGEGYKMKFLGGEGKFVSGWKKYSVAHNLVEGDVVVFHLLRPCYFKVYIIRANDPTVAKRSSLLSNPTFEPVSSLSGMEEIHSSDMEVYPLSACDADFETMTNVAYDNDQTSKRRKTTRARFDSEAHTSALKRAKELQANLSPEHPSFIKQLQRSHVMQKFKPGVPVEFRKLHLPTDDVEVILENECGEGYKMKFLGGTEGKFVSGWKKFSVAHNLVEGDIVVFHLLRPCYFKVYIIRANDPTAVQRSPLLSNPTLEPVSSHSGMEEIHSSDMEAYPISACDAEFETITNVAYDNYQTSKCCMAKRGGISSEAHALALKRAKELQRNLSSEHPSFVKQMQRSSVDQKPMMTVPSEFCGLHLPKHDVEVTLEDESGERYVVKLIPREIKRFRGGWKRFSAAHKLLEGDVVVFHMLRPCYFKVYITRANDPTVVGSPDLASSSNVHANGGKNKRKYDAADTKGRELASQLDTVQEGSSLLSNPNLELEPPHFSMEELHLSDMDAPPSSERDADYKNFRIVVNGEVVDQELSESTRFNYYKLCCSRKSALHHQLLENVGRTLAAGIITGTLEVADAIRTCTLSATDADFAMWDKTLEGFKNFGMDVGFLSDRLKRTASVASDLRKTEEFERYVEAKNKRDCIEKELKSIEDEMKIMEVDLQKFNAHLQEEANAPW